MLAHILSESGFIVGLTSTDGLVIGGEQVREGSHGYRDAASVLKNPSVTAAVLEIGRAALIRHEMGRGGLLSKGLNIDQCRVRSDVAALLNVGWEQVGIDGVDTLDQMIKVKRRVVESARSTVVLNADDRKVRKLISEFPVHRVTVFSFDPECRTVKEHLGRGGTAFCLDESSEPRIARIQGQQVRPVISIADLPSAWNGIVRHNIANAMAAASLADGLGVTSERIQAGLRSFELTVEQLLGRFNIIRDYPFLVIIDRAWSPPAAEALAGCLMEVEVEGCRYCMLTAAGKRPRWHYRKVVTPLAKCFDHFVCYELEEYEVRQGRQFVPGEIGGKLRSELLRLGVKRKQIDLASDYESGLRVLSATLKRGDLAVVVGPVKRKDISTLRTAFASHLVGDQALVN